MRSWKIIVSAREPYAFNEYNGGFIIDPATTAKSLLCSWSTDARSFRAARSCLPQGVRFRWGDGKQLFERREGCVPGCVNGLVNTTEDWDTVMHDKLSPTWCEPGQADSWCPWRPQHLQQMLEQQGRSFRNTDCAQNNGCRYNELILDSRAWVNDLPHTITAIFTLKDSDPEGVVVNQASKTHLDFLTEFGLTDAHIPLVELDFTNLQAPFRVLRNRKLTGTQYTTMEAVDEAAAVPQ